MKPKKKLDKATLKWVALELAEHAKMEHAEAEHFIKFGIGDEFVHRVQGDYAKWLSEFFRDLVEEID